MVPSRFRCDGLATFDARISPDALGEAAPVDAREEVEFVPPRAVPPVECSGRQAFSTPGGLLSRAPPLTR